jgi:hypothetical protein
MITLNTHEISDIMDKVLHGNRYQQILDGINKDLDPNSKVQQEQIRIIKQNINGMETFYHEFGSELGKLNTICCTECAVTGKVPERCVSKDCDPSKLYRTHRK